MTSHTVILTGVGGGGHYHEIYDGHWKAVGKVCDLFAADVISSRAPDVSSNDAVCCSVRLDRSSDNERISPVPPLIVSIANFTPPIAVFKSGRRGIDVLLRRLKRTLEIAAHFYRQVAMLNRGQNALCFSNASVRRAHQFIDAIGEAVEIGVGIVFIDTAGEIPGDARCNHNADAGLEIGALPEEQPFVFARSPSVLTPRVSTQDAAPQCQRPCRVWTPFHPKDHER